MRLFRRLWLRLFILLLILLAADYALYPILTEVGGRSRNSGENGLWLRHTWYSGKWGESDLNQLAARLREGEIRYAFCHVRDVKEDGHLRFRYPESARKLVAALHRQPPSVKALAWVYAGSTGDAAVDLAKPNVRKNMVAEAAWLVSDCGFDGIQWDYEIVRSGDKDFLALLRETRAALPKDKLISVCTPVWYPAPITRLSGWDERYFAQVAAESDQLVVMAYDTGAYLPRAYVWLVQQQVIRVTRVAARGSSKCRVLIGLPTYDKGPPSHCKRAENLRMALKGVREGLSRTGPRPSSFAGISLFADWTTSSDEWRDYKAEWLQKKSAGDSPRDASPPVSHK